MPGSYLQAYRAGRQAVAAAKGRLGRQAALAVRRVMSRAVRGGASRSIAPARRGYQRTSGFYGRFKGPQKELKFFDTTLSFNVDATGEVPATGQLTLIPQGDTESSRDGRQAFIRSIQIRASANMVPAAAATAATNACIMLVLDTQTNGAAAAVTDVMTTNNISGTGLINMANSQRFKILKRWDLVFNSPAGATTAYNNVAKHIEFYKKVAFPMNFNGTTGAITEIRDNNLFLLAGTDGSSDDTVVVSGTARVRFYD